MGSLQQEDEATAAAGVSPSNHTDLQTIKHTGGNINIRYYSHKGLRFACFRKQQ